MRSYLLSRFREASTWRGLVIFIAGLLGFSLSEADALQILAAGQILAGLVGALLPDRVKTCPPPHELTPEEANAAIPAAVKEWIIGQRNRA